MATRKTGTSNDEDQKGILKNVTSFTDEYNDTLPAESRSTAGAVTRKLTNFTPIIGNDDNDDLFETRKLSTIGTTKRAAFRRVSTVHAQGKVKATIKPTVKTLKRNMTVDETKNVDDIEITFLKPFFRRDTIVIGLQSGQLFTEYADQRVDNQPISQSEQWGTIGELQHRMQSGNKNSVKKFLRTNDWEASDRIRARLWIELCYDNESGGRKIVYNEQVHDMRLQLQPAIVKGRHTVRCDHKLNELGIKALMRVLRAIESARPDVTEIPILYSIAALFLHYMPEDESYSALLHLIEKGDHAFMQTDVQVIASRRTALQLVKKHANPSYTHIRKLLPNTTTDNEMINIFAEWKAWLFRDLPFDNQIRIVDCLLHEGQKVQYRALLALMGIYYRARKVSPTLLANGRNTVADVALDISQFCKNSHVPPKKLIKKMYDVHRLKMSTIRKEQANSEMKRRTEAVNEQSTLVTREISQFNFKKLRAAASVDNAFVNILMNFTWISGSMAIELAGWLPTRLSLMHPRLLFESNVQGVSFNRLWQRIDQVDHTVFIIKATANEPEKIFGAYCSRAWSERNSIERQTAKYFGTGESFVFRLANGIDLDYRPERFEWVGEKMRREQGNKTAPLKKSQELFLNAGNSHLKIGGGGGDAIHIEQSLETGRSNWCETFENPPLHTGDPYEPFNINNLIVIGYVDSSNVVLDYEITDAEAENRRL